MHRPQMSGGRRRCTGCKASHRAKGTRTTCVAKRALCNQETTHPVPAVRQVEKLPPYEKQTSTTTAAAAQAATEGA